ncbi:unnamed protein product [Lactuca saligna]|uniref:MULE transposase domain-containing protein n=1 Tax=Lactuca saligna TaxID=75948 RepID=A0AA35YUC1_LACSI|nr:unnamed protein product [Lactuca saligna]
MVYVMWQIRPKNEVVDVSSLYAGAPTWFSIKLHHGGKFTKLPDIKYTGGYPDPRMIELSVESPVIYYHFRIPNGDFQFGLRALGNDQDVINLSKFIQNNKLIEVYTEHGKTNLLTYFMSPNAKGKVVIEELPENDDQGAKYEAEVHVESPLRNMNHVNDEPIGEYMSLILFGSKTDAFSPEYRRGRVGNSKREEGSCSKRLNLEDIDDLKEKENTNEGVKEVHEAATVVEGCYNPFTSNIANVGDEMIGVHDNDHIDGCYNTPPINDDEQYNELFDNLMENLNGSDEYVEEYEGDVESEESDEEYEKDEGDDHDGKQSENEDKVDDIMDEENNIEDVDVDMADFFLNVESDVEGACINDGHEPEDMEVINNEEFESLDEGSDQDRERRALIRNLGKEKRCNLGSVHIQSFSVGQKFKSKKELKELIDVHALETRRNLFFKKNDSQRLRAQCRGVVPVINKGQVGTKPTTSKSKGKEVKTQKETCGWYIHASRSNPESDWFIRTLNQTHTCLQTRKLRACTASLICKKIIDQVEADPKIPLRAIQDHFQKTYQVGISMDKVFRAKDMARKHVTGDYTKQFELLRDYALELQATNPDTTVKIDVCPNGNPASPTRQFRRIYVCLGPLKKGFKACLRDLVGLDGAFMKGPFPGQVLTAVGLDSNNGIYPLAYAIVESENTASWKWFLENLGDDLELGSNSNYTFISDRQKGLQIAVDQLFPNAEHRYCIRHIHDNMRKKWGQTEYRDHLWRCASATTIPEFEHLMKEFSEYDKEACQWLKQIPPVHWARSHFSGRAVSDVLISNMCEVFNGKIEKGRDKPVGRPKKKRRQSEGERLSKRQKASEGDGVNEMQGENSQGPRNDGVQKLSRKHLWFDDVVMYGAQTLVCLTW